MANQIKIVDQWWEDWNESLQSYTTMCVKDENGAILKMMGAYPVSIDFGFDKQDYDEVVNLSLNMSTYAQAGTDLPYSASV